MFSWWKKEGPSIQKADDKTNKITETFDALSQQLRELARLLKVEANTQPPAGLTTYAQAMKQSYLANDKTLFEESSNKLYEIMNEFKDDLEMGSLKSKLSVRDDDLASRIGWVFSQCRGLLAQMERLIGWQPVIGQK